MLACVTFASGCSWILGVSSDPVVVDGTDEGGMDAAMADEDDAADTSTAE